MGLATALLLLITPHATAAQAPAAAAVECSAEAVGEAVAVALAASCDQDVEVVDARTETDALFALADGRLRWERSVGASGRPTEWTVIGAGKKHSTAGYGFAGERRVGPCTRTNARRAPARTRNVSPGSSAGSRSSTASSQRTSSRRRSPRTAPSRSSAAREPWGIRRAGGGPQDVVVRLRRPLGRAPGTSSRGSGAGLCGWAMEAVRHHYGRAGSRGPRRVDARTGPGRGGRGCTTCGTARFGADASVVVVIDRAPRVDALWTSMPASQCLIGAGRPVLRSATPRLQAQVSQPDGLSAGARFAVHRLEDGAIVWESPAGLPMASGSTHSLTVPTGLLADGEVYVWSAVAVGTKGARAPCVLRDADRPRPTHVCPHRHACRGMPAVYREEEIAGQVGLAGRSSSGTEARPASRPTATRSTTTPCTWKPLRVSRWASLRRRPVCTPLPFSPWMWRLHEPGPALHVPGRHTAVTSVVAQWRFDEGSGLVAADGSGQGNDLVLSGEDLWAGGVLAELAGDTNDHGLRFDGLTDTASSAGPVVATIDSFWVSAFVRPDVADGAAVAVSQDGEFGSGFALGLAQGEECPSTTGHAGPSRWRTRTAWASRQRPPWGRPPSRRGSGRRSSECMTRPTTG
ncbi:hypothetical protein NKG05_17385 [Oerskovia sp. M15]